MKRKTFRKISGLFFSSLAACTMYYSQAFAQNSETSLSSIQPVTLPKNLAGQQNLDQNAKRQIAQQGLEQYLNEYLFPNKVADEKKLKDWIKQTSRKRFESLVPSWSVIVKNQNTADVSLVVARPVLQSDIEHSPYTELLDQFFPQSSQSSVNRSSAKTPLAVFLFDESSQDIYIYPWSDVSTPQSRRFKVHAIAEKTDKNYSEADVNTLTPALADRMIRYTNTLKNKFPKQSLDLDSQWSASVFKAIDIAANALDAQSNVPQVSKWPLSATLIHSNLPAQIGTVFVFTVRSSDRTGVIEKADILEFGRKRPIRTYWTRPLHDPLYKESATKIIDRIYTMHQKNISTPIPDLSHATLKIIIDRKVSDKDVVAVESVLKKFLQSNQTALTPVEVTKEDFRYLSPIGPNAIQKVVAQMNTEIPNLFVRVMPSAEQNQIQVVLKTQKQ